MWISPDTSVNMMKYSYKRRRRQQHCKGHTYLSFIHKFSLRFNTVVSFILHPLSYIIYQWQVLTLSLTLLAYGSKPCEMFQWQVQYTISNVTSYKNNYFTTVLTLQPLPFKMFPKTAQQSTYIYIQIRPSKWIDPEDVLASRNT